MLRFPTQLLSKRCFGSIVPGSAPMLKFKANIPFGSKAKELPTPLVFVSGEGLNTNIWSHSIEYFSALGYHGQALELPYGSVADPSVDDLVEYLQDSIKSSGDTPPVLIAHSLSSYIAQKFLESYSLAGLVMVNPVPMNPQKCMSLLLKEWNSAVFKNKNATNESLLRAYYRTSPSSSSSSGNSGSILSEQASHKFRPFSLKLGSYIATNPDAHVNLEPGSVPMAIIASGSDASHFVTDDALQELVVNHDILMEHYYCLHEDPSRLTMLCKDPHSFNSVIREWLDVCT